MTVLPPPHVFVPNMLVASLALSFGLFTDARAQDGADKREFYDPVEREIEGWTVLLDPEILAPANREQGEQALTALANHLQRVKYIVSAERVSQLQKVRIWVDWQHDLGNMQYHPGRGWLLANGYDPRLVRHVHLPRARNLLDRRQWAKHPYAVLHELAHAYHDQVLGFDEPEIRKAYDTIKENGSYERVLLFTGQKARHYGLSNHKEYFAESTEAYFGVNDFYPFVRAELREHDPGMFAIMERVWGPIR